MRLLNLLIHKCEILVLIVNYGCSATIESFPEEEVLIKNKTQSLTQFTAASSVILYLDVIIFTQ